MKSFIKVTEALARIRAQNVNTEDLEDALAEFLAAYGEMRSQLEYSDTTTMRSVRLASTLFDAIDRGLVEFPHATDGSVILPDMLVKLPDGAKLFVDSIELESTVTGHAPVLHWEDGTQSRCRIGSGMEIVRKPMEPADAS